MPNMELEMELGSNQDSQQDDYYREGKIVIIEGPQRSGKTLAMSILALQEYLALPANKRKPVLTNIAFEEPGTNKVRVPFKPLNFFELTMQHINEFLNTCITIDELNFYLDARATMTKVNRRFCQWLLQSKKMGINTYGTTHNLGYLDFRLRDNFDYLIQPKTYYENVLDSRGQPIINFDGTPKVRPAVLVMKWFNGPNQKSFKKTTKIDFRLKPQLLGMYNTRNVFNPFQQIEEEMEREKQEKKIKKNKLSYTPLHKALEEINQEWIQKKAGGLSF